MLRNVVTVSIKTLVLHALEMQGKGRDEASAHSVRSHIIMYICKETGQRKHKKF